MCKRWRSVLALLGLYHVSHLAFEFAGSPLTQNRPVTEEELRLEFGDDLSGVFYWAFARALAWQEAGNTAWARELYERLLASVRQDAALHERVRPFVEHNLRFLT